MKIRRMSMNGKIILLTFFIIAFSFFVAGLLLLSNLLKEKEGAIEQTTMLIARTISNLPELQYQLNNPDIEQASEKINQVIEEIRVINKAEYIVVMNMKQIKLSHPSPSQIGTISESADIAPAFSQHYYVSKARGEKGTMVRAFVPVMNDAKQQIGVVLVGISLPTFKQLLMDYEEEIIFAICLSVLFSIWGAHTLGRHIKKQIFGLEPHEIAKMYVERTETFNAMHDGIIAVDKDLRITIFNEKAAQIIGLSGKAEDYIGVLVNEVYPATKLERIIKTGIPAYNHEISINDYSIISNQIPIRVKNKTVGAVAIFQDLTELKQLAEELTGVKAFVQALRVQTHEYKNKLHTIAGLLQLGHHDQALNYVAQVQQQHDTLTKFFNERIHNENISGLLLSKISRGVELGINVKIDEESQLTAFPPLLDYHDFVVIFGNLIENAFDALTLIEREYKEISISIDDNDGVLAILITDNGIGMTEEEQSQMFKHGFTTKKEEGHGGIGLYLIRKIVQKGHGTMEVISEKNKGTTFMITFEL